MKSALASRMFLFAALGFAVVAQAAPSSAMADTLQAAIEGSQRTPANVARDKYRHPKETLEFFGIRPDMRVIEILPGRGWYTEIFAPFLREHGQLIEAAPPGNSDNAFVREMAAHYAQKLAANPEVYGRVELEPFEPPAYMALGAPNSADMVLTFRNMHDLVFANVHGEVTDAPLQDFLRSAYQVLKPGGVLGVVAHRAKPDMPVGRSYKLGRLPQAFLVRAAERAGFRLAGASDINANPKDPRTMPVWFLPPALKQGKEKRAEYEAIGEADNMTLKFAKPAD